MRPGGEAKRIEPESHPRPVERATTCDGDGGSENKLHVVNISGNQNCVKPKAPDRSYQGPRIEGAARSASRSKSLVISYSGLPVLISVVVRAAEVVAAMGADQLALVSGEAVGAGGADLAVVVDGAFGISRP